MKRAALLLLGVGLLASPISCRKASASSGGNASAVADAGNAFGLDLYAQLAGKEKDNLFISPTSIHTALAMTYAGAGGRTAAQMAKTLHVSAGKGTHPDFAALMETLRTPSQAFRLHIANALWGQQGFPFKETYIGLVNDSYGAEFTALNFLDEKPSVKAVNDWVARQTQDKIKDLISTEDIDSLTRLILTNAIYFKGAWAAKFDKGSTAEGDFHPSTGRTVKAMMMRRHGRYGYAGNDTVQILEMPYASDELSMLVFLPRNADGLADFERSLTPENLAAWLAGLKKVDVTVTVPRFTFTSEFRLADTLKAMGMTDAFDPARADFSGMTIADKLYIDKVIHKSFVAVDEEGTEAAGATAVIARVLSEELAFTADHPFVFLIRHRATGAILFLGRVVEPKTE